MKTKQHTTILATALAIGLLAASPTLVAAASHEHGPKAAKSEGGASDKQAMRHQMMQQMRACMRQMHEGKGGQHGMMQGKMEGMGDMTREQMREQMMGQMEGCMDGMGHGGGMMGYGAGPKHGHGKDGDQKPKHEHGKKE